MAEIFAVPLRGIGLPDYSAPAPRGQVPVGPTYTLTDVGELAARLGSINVYDRRGWTVWMDDFEAPKLKWDTDGSVGATVPVLSTTRAWMGVQSVYLATAAVAGEWTAILKNSPVTRLGKVGIELFTYLHTHTPGYLRFRLEIIDGTNISAAELRLNEEAKTATIVTPAGNIIVATNCFNLGPERVWTPVKMVVDMDTDLYTRLLIGPQEIDLSAYSLVNIAPSTDKELIVHIRLVGDAANAMWSYIDNFILTQNEPKV